jgi:hypothetical protein
VEYPDLMVSKQFSPRAFFRKRGRFAKAFGASVAVLLLFSSQFPAEAQSLPSPSRTIYKCKVNGKVSYTDEPCLGAERLDAQPTRGVSRLSGKQMIGEDVRREMWRENLADALRPISGTTRGEFETLAHRQKLSSNAQHECRILESAIIRTEKLQHTASSDEEALLARRKRYKELGC